MLRMFVKAVRFDDFIKLHQVFPSPMEAVWTYFIKNLWKVY